MRKFVKSRKMAALLIAAAVLAAILCLAVFLPGALRKAKESGEIYVSGDCASKLDYPLKEKSLERAALRFRYLYDNYLAGKGLSIYFSVIPDKNYFLAEESGYSAMDYDQLREDLKNRLDYMQYVEIFDCLELEDYYRTDSHWRQERIGKVARRLGEALGVSQYLAADYEERSAGLFTGSYMREGTLEMAPDELRYLVSPELENCTVYHYLDGRTTPVYDWEKLRDKDAYGFFLSGTDPILTIENPEAGTDRELVIFRDSFCSSLAPLLVGGYRKITLVDIRYVRSDYLGTYLTFQDQDVLFLYSTLVLNNSAILR